MPRGQSSGHRALAHLLAAHSIATPKQVKEPIRALQESCKKFDMNWRRFFLGIGRKKVTTYLSFSHNMLEGPYGFSKETVKAFNKLNDDEVRNLKNTFCALRKMHGVTRRVFLPKHESCSKIKR